MLSIPNNAFPFCLIDPHFHLLLAPLSVIFLLVSEAEETVFCGLNLRLLGFDQGQDRLDAGRVDGLPRNDFNVFVVLRHVELPKLFPSRR